MIDHFICAITPKCVTTVIPTWPPDWGGAYQGHDVFPRGEEGVLFEVEKIESDAKYPESLLLTIDYRNKKYSGMLFIDELDFLNQVFDLLKKSKGKDLVTIGQLEI